MVRRVTGRSKMSCCWVFVEMSQTDSLRKFWVALMFGNSVRLLASSSLPHCFCCAGFLHLLSSAWELVFFSFCMPNSNETSSGYQQSPSRIDFLWAWRRVSGLGWRLQRPTRLRYLRLPRVYIFHITSCRGASRHLLRRSQRLAGGKVSSSCSVSLHLLDIRRNYSSLPVGDPEWDLCVLTGWGKSRAAAAAAALCLPALYFRKHSPCCGSSLVNWLSAFTRFNHVISFKCPVLHDTLILHKIYNKCFMLLHFLEAEDDVDRLYLQTI